ncbi:MAG: AEC family transporter [Erysipelotrichaceae bacterium]|nr:AEC family transporter [Erysipelotrichaceae bacterium]
MEVAIILFKQIIVMFILMFIGVWLFKKGFVSKEGSKQLGSILLYVVIPTIVLKSLWVEYSTARLDILVKTFGMALVALVVSMIISLVFFKRDPVANFSSSFSNAGFIGIPLVQALLGTEAVFYITGIIMMLNLLQWTYGLVVMTGSTEHIKIERLIKNPVLIAFFLGFIAFLLNLPKPEIINTTFNTIAGLNTPLAMIVSGVYLAQCQFRSLFTDVRLYFVSLVRLLIIPVLTILVFSLFPVSLREGSLAVLISASAPVGANVAIFAAQYDADYTYAVRLVCTTTILSIISVPLIVALASLIL